MSKSSKNSPGRPRQFDEAEALQAALELFWDRGYQHVSIDDIMAATGMARASIYRTFGDKRTLFLTALARYTEVVDEKLTHHLTTGSPLAAVLQLLSLWEKSLDSDTPRGCLALNSMAEFGHIEDEEVRARLWAILETIENQLVRALRRAKELGELPESAAPRTIARSLTATSQAATVLGRTGMSAAFRRDMFRGARLLLGS